jgi:hypothetical protein
VVRSVEIPKGDSPGRDLIDLWLEEVEARPVRLRVYEGGQEVASKLIKTPPRGASGASGGEHWALALLEWVMDPDKRALLIEGLGQVMTVMPSISSLAEEWEEGRWRARRRQAELERRAAEAAEAASSPRQSTSAR